MFNKDTLRLIRKTSNRFISLFMIVLIGTAFMMGLLSTRSIMETSVDRYSDEYDLHDLQFYSSYGFCKEDVKAISEDESIDQVFASKFMDVLSEDANGAVRVTRAEEIERNLDRFELINGRMPVNNDEALVLDVGMTKGERHTGEVFTLFSEDEDLNEKLYHKTYTIVGVVKTPAYMAKTLGTSLLHNRNLDLVIYIPAFNFKADYYTTVYATLKDAAALGSFSRRYDDFVTAAKDDIEPMVRTQQDYLKETLLADYRKEIEDGEKELEEKRTEGQQQLDDAKKQLDEANIQIISGEAQIDALQSAMNILLQRQNALEQQYGPGVANAKQNVAQAEEESGMPFDELLAQVSADYASYNAYSSILGNLPESVVSEQIRASMDALDAKYPGGVAAYYEKINGISEDRIYYEVYEREIDMASEAKQRADEELGSLRYNIRVGKEKYEEGLKEYQDGLLEFNTEIEKAELEIRKAKQKLEELPDAQWTVLDRGSHYSTYMYSGNAEQMGSIGIALPVLFFLVAALVCLTTMTRLVDEQRGQIGIFRALGFSRGAITGKYAAYALAASLSGSIIGMAVGMAIFPIVIYETWRLMYDLPPRIMVHPPLYIAICVLSFAMLMCGVTVYVVNKSLKEQPSQLMRPKPPKNAKKVILEKIPFIWNRFSFTGKITARNLIRYKARALMTIIGVAGCTGLLVLGWGIKDSIQDIVSIQFGEIYNYDYTVNMEGDERIDDLIELLKKDDANEAVAPYMTYASKAYLDGSDAAINVVVMDARDGNDMLNLRDAFSKEPLRIRNSGAVVSEKFCRLHGIKDGDVITIESASGLKAQVRVNAVFELYFQHYIYMSQDYYESVFDEPAHYNSIVIRNSEETAAEIEEQISGTEGYESIMDFSGLTNQFTNMISALDFIILVVVLTAGALAFVVLVNLTQVNISERIREIATLKVLGFHDTEVDSYLFKEILLLSVAGAILGMPLGRLEHHFIMNIISMEMVMFGQTVKPLSYLMAFAITIGFTVLVLLFTKIPLKKVQMVESLKSVE